MLCLPWKGNMSGNTSAVNHQGGIRSPHSLMEAQKLLQWALTHLHSITVVNLPGMQNCAVDLLSRQKPPPRVETEPSCSHDDLVEVMCGGGGPLHLQRNNTVPAVVLSVRTGHSVGSGCSGTPKARQSPLCLSSSSTTNVDSSQDQKVAAISARHDFVDG